MAINNTRYGAMSGKETLSIQVPTWHARLLKRWAYVRSRPKSTMATDIIQVG
ncbi:MAG: hypothetical protein F6K35_34450, partial [Okeania sp. SIO2H7]|nr:hypothetical protein [Okeania sp. SIO2H7]